MMMRCLLTVVATVAFAGDAVALCSFFDPVLEGTEQRCSPDHCVVALVAPASIGTLIAEDGTEVTTTTRSLETGTLFRAAGALAAGRWRLTTGGGTPDITVVVGPRAEDFTAEVSRLEWTAGPVCCDEGSATESRREMASVLQVALRPSRPLAVGARLEAWAVASSDPDPVSAGDGFSRAPLPPLRDFSPRVDPMDRTRTDGGPFTVVFFNHELEGSDRLVFRIWEPDGARSDTLSAGIPPRIEVDSRACTGCACESSTLADVSAVGAVMAVAAMARGRRRQRP